MHRFYSYCAQLIGGMIVCLLIISFSVTLTLNFRPLYYADIQHLHIAELSGRNEEDIRQNIDHHIWSDIDRYSPICPKERMALASDWGDFVYCAAGVAWYHGCSELGVCICDFSSACF